jgi:hypothetical protein
MSARQVSIPAIALWTMAALAGHHASASEKFDGFSFITGEEIYKLCRSGEASDQRACAMYVCGMADGWQTEFLFTGKKPFQYCLRAGTTCQELGALIPKFWMKIHGFASPLPVGWFPPLWSKRSHVPDGAYSPRTASFDSRASFGRADNPFDRSAIESSGAARRRAAGLSRMRSVLIARGKPPYPEPRLKGASRRTQ